MSGIINKVKDALHHDKSSTSSTTHTTGAPEDIHSTHGTAQNTTGTGYSTGAGHAGIGSGPGVGGTTHGTTHGTGIGSSTSHGVGHGSSNTTAGPHSSNVANKLDPRIDSDFDGSKRIGGTTGTTGTSGYSGTHAGNTSGAYTGATGGISGSTNAGMFLRVCVPIYKASGTNALQTIGPHESSLANKADPRVDSDLDGRGNRHGAATGGVFGASGSHATAGSGTAQNTAGPHNSDVLNSLDPRVDSDRDGSKTYGGNATHK
ncbi:putative cell surface protein [Diplocarpon rosae]|nr:putative cell surface protein [Diplocarpon rosae]